MSLNTEASPTWRANRRRLRAGFTLVELLVVVSIIALLVAILLPSLTKARKQAKLVMCLSNIKNMGTGVMTYSAEYFGTLPGPLHPAVYRNLGKGHPLGLSYEPTPYARDRQLTWKLRSVMGDKGALIGSATDKLTTCPVLNLIVPDQHFYDFVERFPDRRGLHPTHYCINNWELGTAEDDSVPTIDSEHPRPTMPGSYFGLSHNTADPDKSNSPKNLASIRNASAEWMAADAWYRSTQPMRRDWPWQNGPYQSQWSGEALPNFAPHMRRGSSGYEFTSTAMREQESTRIIGARSDGVTNAAYFDGHGESVTSRQIAFETPSGSFPIFYGFRGTINPNEKYEMQIPR